MKQVTIIAGAQGCGKTTLARNMAAQWGTSFEISMEDFESYFGLGRALESEPDTLIVDGFRDIERALAKIKVALTGDTVLCHRKGQEPKAVRAPNMIFCVDGET